MGTGGAPPPTSAGEPDSHLIPGPQAFGNRACHFTQGTRVRLVLHPRPNLEESDMSQAKPEIATALNGMRQSMGSVPPAMAKAAPVDPALVVEQVHSSAFAMPPGAGALDPETRTLIYLAAALASSNHACTLAMVSRARVQGITSEKLLGALHIARFAMATRVVGDAEPLFEMLAQRQEAPTVAA